MKIISKITIIFALVIIIFLTYFSLVGIETDQFNNQIKSKLTSINKEKLGAAAAKIRSFRKPEPFKGKGIKYIDEYIFRKEGKKK